MGLKPLSTPLLRCWGSTAAPSCTVPAQPDVLQSREMDTNTGFLLLIQYLFKISLPSNEKMTMQIFMKYIYLVSLPCMDPCKLLPS